MADTSCVATAVVAPLTEKADPAVAQHIQQHTGADGVAAGMALFFMADTSCVATAVVAPLTVKAGPAVAKATKHPWALRVGVVGLLPCACRS